MKRRKFITLLLIFLMSFSLISITFAWVSDSGLTSEISVKSHLHKSYFESGDGTGTYSLDTDGYIIPSENAPYEIKYPLQFYYLSWLQEFGFFDNEQTYFYLSDDIDMTGYTIPPIGTPAHPFTGWFNGQGHTISNLVVTDSKTDTTNKPQDEEGENPQIVGLFGVVGNYNEVETYDSSINTLSNFNLNNVTIKTEAPKNNTSIIGIVAGYVDAEISNVAVANSTIDISSSTSALTTLSENRSEYTIIGYCTEDYIEQLDVEYVSEAELVARKSVYNATESGNAWGGSVDMNGIINRLRGIRDNTIDTAYNTGKSSNVSWQGAYVKTSYILNNNADPTQNITVDSYATQALRNDMIYFASENFETGAYYYRDNGSDPTNKMHLNGYTETNKGTTPLKTVNTITLLDEYYNNVYYIISGANYLNVNRPNSPNAVSNGTDQETANKWVYENNKLFTITGPQLSTAADGLKDHDGNNIIGAVIGGFEQAYLNVNNNNNLTIGTTGTTNWNYDSDRDVFYYINNGSMYCLTINGTTWRVSQDQHFVITDGTNYITISGSTLGNGTTLDSAAKFYQDTNGRLYTYSGTSNTKQYLRFDNNAVSFTTTENNGTKITQDTNGIKAVNTDNYLMYKNGTWTYGALSSAGKKISDGNGHYLSINDDHDGVTNTTEENATIWTFSNGTQGTISIKIGTTTYYLRYGSNDNSALRITSSNSYATNWKLDDNKLYIERSGNYYYIKLNYASSQYSWVNSRNSNQATARNNGTGLTIIEALAKLNTEGTTLNPTTTVSTTLQKVSKTIQTNQRSGVISYVPIATVGDKTGYSVIGDYYTADANTGYFVGGSYDLGNYTNQTSGFAGDTRLGVYSNTLSSSFYNKTSKKVLKVKTINSTTSRASDNPSIDLTTFKDSSGHEYVRLKDALKGLEEIIAKDVNYLYGLHFVETQISMDHLVTAPYAKVNGTEYYNYDLPECSLTFNLKEKGYVNFFSGTYYGSASNGFFSFHQIFRNNVKDENGIIIRSEITAIKEIQYIYATEDDATAPYIYKYKNDNVYSDGITRTTAPTSFNVTTDDGTLTYKRVFDTAWITKQSYNISSGSSNAEIYYFEIPANEGEYCLGSFDGGDGEYLMYLDISASAQTVDRVETVEKFEVYEQKQTTPKGVQFVESGSYADYLDSASFTISAAGTYKVTRTGNEINLDNTTKAITSYIYPGNSTNVDSKEKDLVATIYRIVALDKNQTSKKTTKQVTTIIDKDTDRTVIVDGYLIIPGENGALDTELKICSYTFTCSTSTNVKYSYIYIPSTYTYSSIVESDEKLEIDLTLVALNQDKDYKTKINDNYADSTSTNVTISVTANSEITSNEQNLLLSYPGHSYTGVDKNGDMTYSDSITYHNLFHMSQISSSTTSSFEDAIYNFALPNVTYKTGESPDDFTNVTVDVPVVLKIDSVEYETIDVMVDGDVSTINSSIDALSDGYFTVPEEITFTSKDTTN